ncbi:hypothetical protein IGI04_036737, partial [Brassica rapa subsp. trilocularis]
KKKRQTLRAKRSPRLLLHLHLQWSLFPQNRLRLRHQRDSTLSPPSSTINHLRLFLLDKPETDFTAVTSGFNYKKLQQFQDNFSWKRNNCFLVKQFGKGNAKVLFSKESNNLCKLNSYKHSGLAYKKTMTIQVADKEQGVVLGTTKTKTKKQNNLKLYVNKTCQIQEPIRTYKDFDVRLSAEECHYAIYDFDFVTVENCQKSKIFLIAW